MVVPPFDAPALAEAIQSLLADRERRRQMGKLGREYVLAEFSYQYMAKLTLRSYAKALGRDDRQPTTDDRFDLST